MSPLDIFLRFPEGLPSHQQAWNQTFGRSWFGPFSLLKRPFSERRTVPCFLGRVSKWKLLPLRGFFLVPEVLIDPVLPPKRHPREVPRDPLGIFHLLKTPGKESSDKFLIKPTREKNHILGEKRFWTLAKGVHGGQELPLSDPRAQELRPAPWVCSFGGIQRASLVGSFAVWAWTKF